MTHLLFLTLMEVDRTNLIWRHEDEAIVVLVVGLFRTSTSGFGWIFRLICLSQLQKAFTGIWTTCSIGCRKTKQQVVLFCVAESDALRMTTADATVEGTLPPAIMQAFSQYLSELAQPKSTVLQTTMTRSKTQQVTHTPFPEQQRVGP